MDPQPAANGTQVTLTVYRRPDGRIALRAENSSDLLVIELREARHLGQLLLDLAGEPLQAAAASSQQA